MKKKSVPSKNKHASALAQSRWDNTKPEDKKAFIAMLNQARKDKKLSTGRLAE